MQILLILLAGFSTALLQLLFFREILSIFNGIDLIIGFFVSSIFFSSILGIYTSSYFKISKENIKHIHFNIFLLLFFSLISFILLQNIRFIFNIPLGSEVSLKDTFISIFFILFPIGFLQGFLSFMAIKFVTLGEKASNEDITHKHFGNSNRRNYFLPICIYALGFIIASLLYSYLLYSFIGTKVLIILFISLVMMMFIIAKNKTIIIFTLVSICLLFALYLSNLSIDFDKYLLNKNIANTKIERYYSTSYGQIVLTQKNNEYYFLANNSLMFSFPDANIIESEDFCHIPMLHHPNHKDILVIGKIQYIPIIFKHDINNINYVIDDKNIIENIQSNIPNLNNILNDKKLHTYSKNIKSFIKHNKSKYDLVFIALGTPTSLYLNSFYSKEFFETIKYFLKKDGFLALQLPGKMVFNSYITTKINKSIIEALRTSFKEVRVIHGSKNIIIASQNQMPYRMFIKRHLKKICDKTLVLTKHHIDERMDTEKTKFLISELEKLDDRNLTNTIHHPYAMFFSVLYEQAKFSPYLSIFLDKIAHYSYFIIFGIIIIFFLSKSIYKTSAFACTSTTCWLSFISIFILQTFNGKIYKLAGTYLSIFILGTVAGILLAKHTLKSVSLKRKILFTEVLFLIIISALSIILTTTKVNSLVLVIFLFSLGTISSIELLFITEIYTTYSNKLENIKKIFLSGAFGAFSASLLGGSFLILVWGMQNSILFILFFKFLIFCRWADLRKYRN
ncbi:MAG: hypothetical protein LBF23_01300 [Endomicrobium sp.]|jgi:spermidine synthase|nr:hypothetical protein [Endomicrobium sp.]